jgi:hypothetical protein
VKSELLRDLAGLVLPTVAPTIAHVIGCAGGHSSQEFPDQVRRDLLESLRARAINHKFHYDSARQTVKWLALHEAYSPTRTDDDCLHATGFRRHCKELRRSPCI